MSIGETLLLSALVVTVGHMVFDVMLAVRHSVHPMDTWLTSGSICFLVGHLILTGEASAWLRLIGLEVR